MNDVRNRRSPSPGSYGIKPATCVFRDGAPQGMIAKCYYCAEPTSQPCCADCLTAQLDWREEVVRIEELQSLYDAIKQCWSDCQIPAQRVGYKNSLEIIRRRIKELKGDE